MVKIMQLVCQNKINQQYQHLIKTNRYRTILAVGQNRKYMLKCDDSYHLFAITMSDSATYPIHAIGRIHSPYAQKFAVPRQPGLVTAAQASIELLGEAATADSVRGLEQFSHIWVMFIFDQTHQQGWKPLVRPPRLGGNQKLGVFATRSTFRPNPIGLSVVELKGIRNEQGRIFIDVTGGDWVNGTPVIDIKPYVPYADAPPHAQGGFAHEQPDATLTTEFSDTAKQQLAHLQLHYPQLELLIQQVLAQDPRPAYQRENASNKEYGMSLYDLNIRWTVQNQQNHVISISKDF